METRFQEGESRRAKWGKPLSSPGPSERGESESVGWGCVTIQHGSTPPGGQPEDSGGWTGGGGGWCVALRIRVKEVVPYPAC